jgi:type VI secretion system protein ImpL
LVEHDLAKVGVASSSLVSRSISFRNAAQSSGVFVFAFWVNAAEGADGRYPFSATGHDASLEDFEAFFGPRGRLQQFQDRYLNVFVRDNLDALRTTDKSGYLVRADVLEQLRAAERIRETFFNNQGGLGVQFSLEPLGLSGNKRSSVLALDGQLISYSHGPSSRVGLIWPNTLGTGPGSRVALVHAQGTTGSLGYKGPWSLFRLLSSGQLYGRTDTSVDLSFRIGDGIMRYRINAEKSSTRSPSGRSVVLPCRAPCWRRLEWRVA